MIQKKTLLYMILLIFALNLTGCDFFGGGGKSPDDKTQTEKFSFTVYRPDKDGEWLHAEKYELEIKKDTDKLKTALDTLVEGKPLSSSLINIFPEKTKILGVKTKDGIAEIDLSKEILKGTSGGSLAEMMMVSSLVNTATEFSGVKSVQITVEGKKIETIGGHMDVLDTLQRNESLIKK